MSFQAQSEWPTVAFDTKLRSRAVCGAAHVTSCLLTGRSRFLDPDTDFSAVEPLKAISGISVDRPYFGSMSTLQFKLGCGDIKLRDTVSSDEVRGRITKSLAQMFPGAIPLSHLQSFERLVNVANTRFVRDTERATYAARGEVAPRDLRTIAGDKTPNSSGPIGYMNDGYDSKDVFMGVAVVTHDTCSFGFVQPDGEVIRWDWFDFQDVFVLGWRKRPDSLLAEIGSRKPPQQSKQRLSANEAAAVQKITGDLSETRRLVRFLDGPEGILKLIVGRVWSMSRFEVRGHVGPESEVVGLKLLLAEQ